MAPFVIPRVSLPSQNLKQLWKTISWIPFSSSLQRRNNRFVTRSIRTIMINRSTQVKAPTGLTDTKHERRYQMSDQLMLNGWFQSFFSITSFNVRLSRLMSANFCLRRQFSSSDPTHVIWTQA